MLRELAKPDAVRGFDLAGTVTFVVGLTALVLRRSRGGLSGWNEPIVIGGFAVAAVLLPIWVLIERRGRAPMLDLTIFSNRLFAAASVATFINGLVALRADVHLRLLLPGRPGRLADHGRASSSRRWRSGC